MDYRIICSDSHVNEPPDLWLSRAPAKLRDRVPHIEKFEQGEAWVLEGSKDPINFGMNACAGLAPHSSSRSAATTNTPPARGGRWPRGGVTALGCRRSRGTRHRA